MQFLYPKSRQFPFDEVCEQIVRALEARAWKVPGFTLEFREYGSGAQKLRYVSKIASDQTALDLGHHDVAIHFGRPQGLLPGGRWNDVAAVDQVQLAKRALHVYEDESGPTYHIYVGNAWEHDRATWWTRPNAALNNAPRRCVTYKGAYPRYRGERPSQLVGCDDYREYAPRGREPRSFSTAEVMEEFRLYLRDVVLPAVEAPPVVESGEASVLLPPLPMPDGAGPFFTYGEPRDERRIATGKKDPSALPLADQYGLLGSGWRLAPLGLKSGPDLPEVAYDGFLWCGTTPDIPGERAGYCADVLIKVTPKDARGIYVADHAAYERRRAELAVAIEGQRDRFTCEEVNGPVRARACTIVPLLDYKGDYETPVYLINRELGFDEVEVIGERAT